MNWPLLYPKVINYDESTIRNYLFFNSFPNLFDVICWIIKKVLEKHGVGYILDGGSALGAERHKGMIPWDDDLDIAVHEDYESLLINEVAADLCKMTIIFLPEIILKS